MLKFVTHGITFTAILAAGFLIGQISGQVDWIYYDSTGNPGCITRTCFYWKAKATEAEQVRWSISKSNSYFKDVQVAINGRKATSEEVLQLLSGMPQVTGLSRPIAGSYRDDLGADLESLSYPQYEHLYTLSPEAWQRLQSLCRAKLQTGSAADSVLAHWKSIADGTPPFGLEVSK